MRIVSAALLAAAALMTTSSAGAQTPAPAATPAVAVSPEKLALAHQVIQASGGEKQMTTIMDSMYSAMLQPLIQSAQPAQRPLVEDIQQEMKVEMIKLVPTLMDSAARIWAENLTEKELTDEVAWLESDSGRSIRQKTPAIMQEMLTTTVPLVQKLVPGMMQRVMENACQRQHCSEQDRQAIAAAFAKRVG
jgi:hypothetical protein